LVAVSDKTIGEMDCDAKRFGTAHSGGMHNPLRSEWHSGKMLHMDSIWLAL